ncbi:IclR family transcriptional regulator [Streptomyces sp. NPDC087512]|uniref:IclR family transcriptional regulator n=1 Tax=Streptomyces sp. NPDC087512 TaxID=3155059 RepID=UPI00344579E1
MSDVNDSTTLQTLERGLMVLEAIASSEGAATAKTLSRHLGINLGTCYHLLRTLRAGEYVVRLKGGSYDVGPRAAALSRHLQRRSGPAVELAMILTRLHQRTQETVYMTGWYHGRLFLQHFLLGPETVRVDNLDVGCTGYMHARASCKAVLAFLPAETVELLFDDLSLSALTPRTITDWSVFVADLAGARSRGYATDLEEFAMGFCCVAAPFFDESGTPVGAYTLALTKERFQQRGNVLIAEVRDAASRATTLIRSGRVNLQRAELDASL